MKFKLVSSGFLPLDPQTHWVWFSSGSRAFIVGDEHLSFAVAETSAVQHAVQLLPERVEGTRHGTNLPLPESLLDEYLSKSWHGFQWLDRIASAHARDSSGLPEGDLLRTIVFGPDYGQYVMLPSNRAVVSMRSGSLGLHQYTANAFSHLEKVKTRGRAVLAFAAHPHEPFIVYGDNYGDFFSHQVGTEEFGKTAKIAGHERKASQVDFIDDGNTLILGGMGYLAVYKYAAGMFVLSHEHASAVRAFSWLEWKRLLVVNNGMHGVSVLALTDAGFSLVSELETDGTVHALATSADGSLVGILYQGTGRFAIHSLE
jgi:hypothetical protein